MDDLQKSVRPGAPREPVTPEMERRITIRAMSAISTAHGNLGMVMTDLRKLPDTNLRTQLIMEIGGTLRGLQVAVDLAKSTVRNGS